MIKFGKHFIAYSTPTWHVLLAVHSEFRISPYVRVLGKPGYKRSYLGFIEIEVRN